MPHNHTYADLLRLNAWIRKNSDTWYLHCTTRTVQESKLYPVPAYMTSGRAGSISSELIAMFVRPSPVGRQVTALSSLFQMPPDTPAANSVVGTVG